MIIKKLLIPLLLVTQICYGADTDTDEDKFADAQQELVNVFATLNRIEGCIKGDHSRLNLYSAEIAKATRIFGIKLLDIEKDLTDDSEKPRSVVPQPSKKDVIPEYDLPGL